jgi:hypothetical protein
LNDGLPTSLGEQLATERRGRVVGESPTPTEGLLRGCLLGNDDFVAQRANGVAQNGDDHVLHVGKVVAPISGHFQPRIAVSSLTIEANEGEDVGRGVERQSLARLWHGTIEQDMRAARAADLVFLERFGVEFVVLDSFIADQALGGRVLVENRVGQPH